MSTGLAQWQFVIAVVGALFLLFAGRWAWRRLAIRREMMERIEAARVRSGHIPLEIPTVRGTIGNVDGETEPDTLPEWFIQGKGEHAVVDEQPRVRLRYMDAKGKKHECVLQVDHLDVLKKTVTGYGEFPGDLRRLPLHRIISARIAETGQRFNIDTWVDAVRVARRRRGQGLSAD